MTVKPSRDRLLDHTLKHGLSSAAAWGRESECLDAETLAAWTDGNLEPHQAALAETHLSNCGQCQELLATLTLVLPPAASRNPMGALADWRWWLVPMTAAAAVGLWMIVPQRDYLASPAPAAKVAEAIPPAPAPSTAAPASERTTTPAPGRAEPATTSQAPAAPAPATPAPEAPRPATQAAPEKARAEEFRMSAPPPAPPPAPSLAETVTARPASPPAVAAPPAAAAASPGQVVSPDSRFRWRYSANGLDRTTDGGTTWEQVSAAIGRFVTAGTAPSATVCWLVARGGGVYVTDDGRNFFRARFPEITNLVNVTATSRAAAAVTTDDGRTFVTSDGGVTWRQR